MKNINKILLNMSYHAVYDNSILDAISFAKENGFSGIQWPVELPHLSYEKLTPRQIEQISLEAQKNNISINLHAHDETASLWESNKHLLSGIKSYYKGLIEFASIINASLITIHPGLKISYPTDLNRDSNSLIPDKDLVSLEKSFISNLDFLVNLNNNGTSICIENCNFTDELMIIVQPYLENNNLFLCWDIPKTYHKNSKVNETIEQYYMNNLQYVKQVHLHDMTKDGKSHKVIGSGIIDFKKYLSVLKDYNIVDYCIEVRPRDKAKESLEYLKTILK